jgi:hypothetical protein
MQRPGALLVSETAPGLRPLRYLVCLL